MKDDVTNLNKCESYFYFCAWSGAIFYSIYRVFLINTYFVNYHDIYSDFAPGWSWLGRKQDVSDVEWRISIPLIFILLPWIFIHHLISQIIKTMANNMFLLYFWYICVSVAFVYYYLGGYSTLCILVQSCLLYFLIYIRSASIIWFIHIMFLFVIHLLKIPDGIFQHWLQLDYEKHYVLTIAMCWIQLKSISQNFDYSKKCNLSNAHNFITSFLQNLAYCLYIPTLFLGPLTLYSEFVDATKISSASCDLKRLKNLVLNLIRYSFWIHFTEFCLHFVYFNALQYHPEVVQNLSAWALYGLGYLMGQYFLNKYVVIYGIASTLCIIDGIPAPPQPKCIARIHLYSDMWKYFDRGLYKFLIRYIYKPTVNTKFFFGKFFSSLLCFAFVFIWHGMHMNVFTWTFLNFIGLTIESIAKSIGKTPKYNEIIKKYLTPKNIRRFHCILASPLLAMSAISNFYFFAGQEIGNIYIQKVLQGSWENLIVLLFSLYCCCQVSVDVKKWESQLPRKKPNCYLL